MELPLWFQDAIQERLDDISAQVQFHPSMNQHRVEEKRAFEALFSCADLMSSPEFVDWEDKHHYRRALENERLYLQGIRDGARLVISLMSDPYSPLTDHCPEEKEKQKSETGL